MAETRAVSHIAFIIPTLDNLGGAERQVLLLASRFRARRWMVSVVVLAGAGGDSASHLRAEGIHFLSLEMRKGLADPRGWLRFHKWLRDARPDILHAHLPHAVMLARWSRLFVPGSVLVDTIHTSATGPLGRRLAYRASDWLTDHVTAVSHDVADAWTAAGSVSSRHFQVLPNGVDTEYWQSAPNTRAATRRRLCVDDDFLWFSAGRLDPVKDYPALLRAFVDVPEHACLVIAGAGPDDAQLRRRVVELGLESRVRVMGFEAEVRSWMQAADAFVLSSRWEGLPMSLLEAGACGLAAVATDVPGSRAVLVHGHTGFLAAPGSDSALLEAMTRLMSLSPVEKSLMEQNARLRCVRNFNLDTIVSRWETLFTGLLCEQGPPAHHPTL